MRDAETGEEVLVDTSTEKLRTAFKEKRIKAKKELREKFIRSKIDTIELHTNESYVKPLMNFFQRRVKRY